MIVNLRRLGGNIACLAAAGVIISTAAGHFENSGAVTQAPPWQSPPKPQLAYLGVYEPRSPRSYAGVQRFSRLIRDTPDIAVYYSSWWEPFQAKFAREARRHHAIPMVQMEPAGVSLAAIAGGKYDNYLREYARAVRAFHDTVIFSFGHEMNASWYSWGYKRTAARTFVAAWKHIHNFFTACGAHNIKWLWAVNVIGDRQVSGTVRAWWPGSAYVTWIGIDGHYFDPHITFGSLFGTTLAGLRRLPRRPILIAEAGIAPHVGTSKIADLFNGAKAHRMIGVIWFDVKGHNIRIEKSRAAIMAFRMAMQRDFAVPAKRPVAQPRANRRQEAAQ